MRHLPPNLMECHSAYVAKRALLLPALMLTACVPYPTYKTLAPEASVLVVDSARKPIAGVEATLVSTSYPHRVVRHRAVKETGADGVAVFSSQREWRVETLMIHGAQEFFWNWCVRKDGYTTFATVYNGAASFNSDLTVQLLPGPSQPCPSFGQE